MERWSTMMRRRQWIPRLFSMLEELRARGVHWAINTGRDLPFVDEGLREYWVSDRAGFCVNR